MNSKWLWLWYVVLAAWTVGLLVPDPLRPERGADEAALSTLFLASKAVHLSVYAGLAALACRLPGRPWRLGLLVLHAGLGEWLQFQFTTRSGSVRDVGIDLVGMALGCALAWPRKKAPPRQ